MPDCCVCYTTDRNYLFACFVSALQARTHSDPARVDVTIFAFDLDASTEDIFGRACQDAGVGLIHCNSSQIHGAPILLSRLFLAELLPRQYSTFLFLDGDTLITGSLAPLLEFDLSGGRFLAANDPMTFVLPGTDRQSQVISDHFTSIGLTPPQSAQYFNAGVILADRTGWERIGNAAWALLRSRQHEWKFWDQDLLNIAGGAQRLPMSLAWNFPIFMRNARVEAEVAPRITHYMSKPKPWEGAFPPWNRAAFQTYLDAGRRFPDIARYRPVMAPRTRVRYHAQQRYKKFMETFTWGLSIKRTRILDYERQVAVARVR